MRLRPDARLILWIAPFALVAVILFEGARWALKVVGIVLFSLIEPI
jgi:hypothetical protein